MTDVVQVAGWTLLAFIGFFFLIVVLLLYKAAEYTIRDVIAERRQQNAIDPLEKSWLLVVEDNIRFDEEQERAA
jgi:uncharacterized membrane protein